VSRKLLEDAAAGILGNELGKVAARLGRLLAENLSGSVDLDSAFSFRWNRFGPGIVGKWPMRRMYCSRQGGRTDPVQ